MIAPSKQFEKPGGCSEVQVYPGVDHIVVAASVPRLEDAPVLDDLVAFLREPRSIC